MSRCLRLPRATFKSCWPDCPARYVSPLFERAARAKADLDPTIQENILEQVKLTGSCQDVQEVPQELRDVFVVSSDIEAENCQVQNALRLFVDASISKTINFPAAATAEDVAWRTPLHSPGTWAARG